MAMNIYVKQKYRKFDMITKNQKKQCDCVRSRTINIRIKKV